MTEPSGDGGFQPEPGQVRWRLRFRSPPGRVYQAIATDEGRATFWAESAVEEDGVIRFVVPGDHASEGTILERTPDETFATKYFGWTVRFELAADSAGGTELRLTCSNIPERDRMEVAAGWVSVLLALKAAVDFAVDLRNHDPERTWWQSYADN